MALRILENVVQNNALTGNPQTPWSTAITVDNTAPTVSIGAPNRTVVKNGVLGANTVDFVVTYSGATTIGLSESHVSLNTVGATCANIVVSSVDTANRKVSVSGCTGDGTVGIFVVAGTAADDATNPTASGTSTTFAVDNTRPSVSVATPSPAAVNSTGTATFVVTYTGHTTLSLSTNEVSQNATGATCGAVAVITVDSATRNVVLSFCTGDGTV